MFENNLKEAAKNLREIIKKEKLSQDSAAEEAGVSLRTLTRFLNGKVRMPNTSTLALLCNRFGSEWLMPSGNEYSLRNVGSQFKIDCIGCEGLASDAYFTTRLVKKELEATEIESSGTVKGKRRWSRRKSLYYDLALYACGSCQRKVLELIDNKNYIDLILNLKSDFDYSNEQLATKLKISTATLYKIENNDDSIKYLKPETALQIYKLNLEYKPSDDKKVALDYLMHESEKDGVMEIIWAHDEQIREEIWELIYPEISDYVNTVNNCCDLGAKSIFDDLVYDLEDVIVSRGTTILEFICGYNYEAVSGYPEFESIGGVDGNAKCIIEIDEYDYDKVTNSISVVLEK